MFSRIWWNIFNVFIIISQLNVDEVADEGDDKDEDEGVDEDRCEEVKEEENIRSLSSE